MTASWREFGVEDATRLFGGALASRRRGGKPSTHIHQMFILLHNFMSIQHVFKLRIHSSGIVMRYNSYQAFDLSPLTKNIVKLGKRDPVSHIVILVDTLNCLLDTSFAQRNLLDP